MYRLIHYTTTSPKGLVAPRSRPGRNTFGVGEIQHATRRPPQPVPCCAALHRVLVCRHHGRFHLEPFQRLNPEPASQPASSPTTPDWNGTTDERRDSVSNDLVELYLGVGVGRGPPVTPVRVNERKP